uniref:Uncharacterized protein n=1 Tax=Lepeophtheirus salmonis TaxID=72036 RepID=A0A0K2UU08_LEPSM
MSLRSRPSNFRREEILKWGFCLQYLVYEYKIVCTRQLTVSTKLSFDKIALYLPWKAVFEATIF